MSCIDNKTSSPKSQDGNPPLRDVTAKKQQAVECARKAECSENVRFGKFLPRFNENLRQNYLTAYETYAIFMTSRQARGGKGTDPPLPTLKTLVKSKEELFYGTDAQRTDTGLPVGDGVRRCAGRSLILPDPRANMAGSTRSIRRKRDTFFTTGCSPENIPTTRSSPWH